MRRFDAQVESLQQLPAFQEVVLCVYCGLSWTEASHMTRRERTAFLNCYGEIKQEEARLLNGGSPPARNDDVDDE